MNTLNDRNPAQYNKVADDDGYTGSSFSSAKGEPACSETSASTVIVGTDDNAAADVVSCGALRFTITSSDSCRFDECTVSETGELMASECVEEAVRLRKNDEMLAGITIGLTHAGQSNLALPTCGVTGYLSDVSALHAWRQSYRTNSNALKLGGSGQPLEQTCCADQSISTARR
jgi:hypothetical protein